MSYTHALFDMPVPLPGGSHESYARGLDYEIHELTHGIRIVDRRTRKWKMVPWSRIKALEGEGAWPEEQALEFNPAGLKKARP